MTCTHRSWSGTTSTPATYPGAARGRTVGGDGLGVHAPADAGLAGAPGLRRLDGDVADSGGTRRRAQRRGGPGLGAARLPAPCPPPACSGPGHRGAARRRGPGHLRRPAGAAGGRRLHRQRDRVVRASGPGTPCSTPTCAGCSPAPWAASSSPPPASPGPSATAPRHSSPDDQPATWAVAVMELGALVCTAASPSCGRCPVADQCAWTLAGRPAYDGPPRRGQAWAGTDRQVRGRLMAVLREAEGSVARTRLEQAWPEPVQRERALAEPARRRPRGRDRRRALRPPRLRDPDVMRGVRRRDHLV